MGPRQVPNAEQDIVIPAWVDGVLTPVEKRAVHLLGLRHRAVSVFVINRGKILIQQRALHKYHTPGLWANTCCTHPMWGEDPTDCAVRRLAEEMGITDVTPLYRGQIEYLADVGGGMTEHEVVDLFMVTAADGLNVTPNPEEVLATRWIAIAQLVDEVRKTPAKFTPWLRIYLDQHLGTILGD